MNSRFYNGAPPYRKLRRRALNAVLPEHYIEEKAQYRNGGTVVLRELVFSSASAKGTPSTSSSLKLHRLHKK